jgi:hypothetical protein
MSKKGSPTALSDRSLVTAAIDAARESTQDRLAAKHGARTDPFSLVQTSKYRFQVVRRRSYIIGGQFKAQVFEPVSGKLTRVDALNTIRTLRMQDAERRRAGRVG